MKSTEKGKPAPAETKLAKKPKGGLSKYQKFEVQRVARKQLKNAPYNPRVIDEYTERKLREVLRTKGLVEALVWNKQTGHLVGGHQRIAQLDALEGRDDYELDVCVIDVPLKREKELNIILNNPSIQGQFDLDAFAPMLQDIDMNGLGFDLADYQNMFEGTQWSALFEPPPTEEESKSLEELEAMGAKAAPLPPDAEAPAGRLMNGDAIRDPERHAEVINERDKMRDRINNDPLRQTDFYLIIVCKDGEEASRLSAELHAKDKYVDGRWLMKRLGLESE